MTNSKWHRQNALALLVLAFHYAWSAAIAVLINGFKDLVHHPLQSLLIGAVVWMAMLVFGALPVYLTTKYRLTESELILRKGILRRRVLHINYAHIQTVQHSQWFFFKPFGVESLTVETAAHAGNQPEVTLTAVPLTVAQMIDQRQQTLRTGAAGSVAAESVVATAVPTGPQQAAATSMSAPTNAVSAEQNTSAPLYTHQLDFSELLAYALTSLGFVSTLLLICSFGSYIGEVPWLEHFMSSTLAQLAAAALVGLAVLVLTLAFLISLVTTMARYWHFTVSFDGTEVKTARGLLQTNRVAAPVRRIQAVRYKQNIIRQLLHTGTAQVVLASAVGKSDDDDDMVLYPLAPKTNVWANLHRLVSWLPSTQPQMQRFRTGRLAMVRNAVWFPLLLAAVLNHFFHPWGLLSFVLAVWALACGVFAAHARGLAVQDDVLFLDTGSFMVQHNFAVPRVHIQSVEIKQSWWMARRRQVTVAVHVRKGNGDEEIALEYVPAAVGWRVYAWYLQSEVPAPD